MSLQHAANYLASRGRGPDDTLVHMTRGEVKSLQEIARAHGGSLSINPDTGLVEAGFLKNLLPMIAGAGITALTGGAAAPWMIGLGVGGVQAARTGSLEKGLMAGLGAYGGSGLMTGLSASAGAAEAANPASSFAGKAVPPIEQINPSNALSIGDKLKYGIQGLGTEAGRGAALSSLGGGFGAAKTAGMALAPALMDSGDQGPPPSDNERYNYSFDPGRVTDPNAGYTGAATGERTYFRPSYTRLPNTKGFNEGGIAHFDEGGDTSDVPPYKPNTALLQGAAAMNNVRPFTGNVPFAQPASSPAQVGSIQPTTSNPFYTMTGESGDAYRYLMGLGPTSAATNPVIATKPNITTQPTGGGDGGGGGGASPIMGGASVGNAPPAEVDPYDQENQDAINKIEEEVANEQYDQDRQDAIDRYEQSLYDQESQDAINKIEQEVAGENAYNESLNDDELGYLRDNNPYTSPQNETTPVNPTPEELLNRDEFGDLQAAIDTNTNIDASAAALEREALARENPWGNLDAAIAANNYEDSRRASDIDAATIAVDNYDTYSGFKPEPANPNIPVEDRAPEPVQPTPVQQEPAPYQGDPYTEPYVPYQGDPYTEPYVPYQGDPYTEPYVPEPIQPEPVPVQPTPVREEPVREEPVREEPVREEPVREEPTPYDQNYVEPVQQQETPVQPEPVQQEAPVQEVAQNYTPAEQEAVTSDVQEVIDALQGDSDAGGDFGDLGFEQSDDFGKYGLGVSDFGGSNFDEDSYDFQGMANGGLMAAHRYAMGGSTLGGYSDGGRLLRGPGDGVSDSIPATIGAKRQPARLADGEFVVPARIVSELGNGSTEAGARKLYAMMERIQATRGRTVGKNRVATNSRADRYLPA